jgi:polyisoprenoid-binding protein YceI
MAESNAAVARYALDPAVSRLQIRAFSTGILAGFGHDPTLLARDFSGEIRVPPGGPVEGSLDLRVKAKSLAASNDIKEKDRREIERIMHGEILESATFPEIVFRSTAVSGEKTGEGQYRLTLDGELSLHGVTASQQLVVYFAITEEQAKAWGETSLLQTRFGIQPVSIAGGTLKVKDELKLSFDLVARRERE